MERQHVTAHLSYADALKEARKVGAAHAEGDALMAQTVASVCLVHPGATPKLIYDGALKTDTSWRDVVKLAATDAFAFSDLMFV